MEKTQKSEQHDELTTISTQEQNGTLETAPEPVPECDDDDNGASPEEIPAGDSDNRMAALLAEAEQKGYLRGRNESIAHLMADPSLYEREESTGVAETEQVAILQRERISIWDL